MTHSRAAVTHTLDELPKFSPWPARLLGLEPWKHRSKTPEEVSREYEREKWGPLLERVRGSENPVSLEQVDHWALDGVPDSLCSIGDELELLPAAEAHGRYLDLVEMELMSHDPAESLVELGAGYGSVVLALAQRRAFSQARIFAGEYTASGQEMMRLMRVSGVDLTVGHCDFASRAVVDFELPRRAIIYTSFASCYVPTLDSAFVDSLSRLDPAVVVHFEPCYEHCDDDTMLGLMRRRYIEVNGYNTNLVTVLHAAQDSGSIRIVREKAAVFGANPLLPASIIAWVPNA